MELARKLCDELLGKDRNKLPEQGQKGRQWQRPGFEDEQACPYYLVSDFCPYEQFLNTKSDIGRCPFKVHPGEEARAEFILANNSGLKERLERECVHLYQRLVSDMDKRIQRSQERLQVKPTEQVLQVIKPNRDVNEERIALLDVQLQACIVDMEKYAEEGRVIDAQALDQRAEQLRQEIKALKDDINPMFKQEQQMQVCQICGGFIVTDGAGGHRADFHFDGRQHIGYSKLREQLKALKERHRRHTDRSVYDRSRSPHRDRRPY